MKITWIKSNYSLKNDEGDQSDIIHGSKQSGRKFIQMWNELTRSDQWCAIYCSETMVHGERSRQKNTWAEEWQLGKIIGLIRPRGGISNLKERDESGKDRWTISGHLERLEEFLESEVVALAPLVEKTLGPAALPGKV